MLKIVVTIRLINRDEQESSSFVSYQDWSYLPRIGDVMQFVMDSELESFRFARQGIVKNLVHNLRDQFVTVTTEPITVAKRADFIKVWDEFESLGFLPGSPRPEMVLSTPSGST